MSKLVIVIGRGHGGTRAASFTLQASGFMMGRTNACGDLVPFEPWPQACEPMYEAARMAGALVRSTGDGEWDLGDLIGSPPPHRYTELVHQYARSVLESKAPKRGWKLPETVLSLPWIVKLFPEAYYVYWRRGLADSVSKAHATDDLTHWGVACARPKTVQQMRRESWTYQRLLMASTPEPERVCHIDFESYVRDQARVLRRLGDFLGEKIARLPVDPTWVRS